jgi:hypothetical protein
MTPAPPVITKLVDECNFGKSEPWRKTDKS